MKHILLTIPAFLLLCVPHSGAQPARRTPGGSSPRQALDMTRVRTISGKVASVDIGYGTQYPSFTIGSVTIKAAPVWYLLDNGFELKAGDTVEVLAAPCTLPADSYLYAIQIVNAASGAKIVLRDSLGVPLWAGQSTGMPSSQRRTAGSGCVDPLTIATTSGTVEKVTSGYALQMPTVVLKQDNGTLLTLKIGPERILLEADFELNPGDRMTVRYAYAPCNDEYLALQLVNSAGTVLTLRDDDGTPAWN